MLTPRFCSASSPPPPALPESPLVATDGTSIPFFASGNLQTNTDYSSGGANTRTITSTGNSYTYYGCFLDIYSGNYTILSNGNPTPVSAFMPGGHQCLVAQIAFDDAPILTLNGVTPTPQNCPQLAQRNLQVSVSDNPGPLETHLIPQTFDVAPTAAPPANPGQFVDLPDELMIDWGNTPIGSTAQIYWPSLTVSDVISLAKKLYPTHQLRTVAGDPNTIEVTVPEGFTIVPIPFDTGANIAGLFTIQLPLGIVQGQEFLLTVRRISSRIYQIDKVPEIARQAVSNGTPQSFSRAPPIEAHNYRYTAGIFAVKIPVVVGREMLPIELDAQSIIAWRLNQMSPTDRWYKVMQRYLSYINGRVSGLGGLGPVVPSPTGIPPGSGEGPKPCHHHHRHRHHETCGCCGPTHEKPKDSGCGCCGCSDCCGPTHEKPKSLGCGYSYPKPSPPKTHPIPCAKHPQHPHSSCPECKPGHSGTIPPPKSHCGVITHLFHDRYGKFCGFQLKPHDGDDEVCFRHVEPRICDLVSRAWKECHSVEVECCEKGGEKEVTGLALKKQDYEV